MRIALISDIHGNLVALDAVLADLVGESIDRLVFLGDVASDGPRPRDVLRRIRARDALVIMGNADAYLLDPIEPAATLSATRPHAPWVVPINRWCQGQLTVDDRAAIMSFSPPTEIPLGGALTLLCCHGSPRSWSDNILAVTPVEQVEAWLAGTSAAFVAVGHTHEPLLRRVGGRTVVNPGSVGAPFDRRYLPGEFRMLPTADYAVIDANASRAAVSFRHVAIDLDALEADARASGMPEVDGWLSMWRR